MTYNNFDISFSFFVKRSSELFGAARRTGRWLPRAAARRRPTSERSATPGPRRRALRPTSQGAERKADDRHGIHCKDLINKQQRN